MALNDEVNTITDQYEHQVRVVLVSEDMESLKNVLHEFYAEIEKQKYKVDILAEPDQFLGTRCRNIQVDEASKIRYRRRMRRYRKMISSKVKKMFSINPINP